MNQITCRSRDTAVTDLAELSGIDEQCSAGFAQTRYAVIWGGAPAAIPESPMQREEISQRIRVGRSRPYRTAVVFNGGALRDALCHWVLSNAAWATPEIDPPSEDRSPCAAKNNGL